MTNFHISSKLINDYSVERPLGRRHQMFRLAFVAKGDSEILSDDFASPSTAQMHFDWWHSRAEFGNQCLGRNSGATFKDTWNMICLFMLQIMRAIYSYVTILLSLDVWAEWSGNGIKSGCSGFKLYYLTENTNSHFSWLNKHSHVLYLININITLEHPVFPTFTTVHIRLNSGHNLSFFQWL